MLLSAEHLSINFGSRQLLDDVNFYLNEGDKVGVIGINGTGKSTFLKVLSGVTEPITKAEATVGGQVFPASDSLKTVRQADPFIHLIF